MADTKIYMDCPFCDGGQRAGVVDCEHCNTTGFLLCGKWEGDFAALVTKCNEIMEKCNDIYDFITS